MNVPATLRVSTLVIAYLLAAAGGCSRDTPLLGTDAPPAEQTRLANVGRLFGEGRALDHPVYAPAGDSLAFIAKLSPAGRSQVYVSDLRGQGMRQLTTAPGTNSGPAWEPGGTWLAYATVRTLAWDIWRVARDGSFDEPLTADPFEDRDPAVSPQGDAIVFAAKRDTTVQPMTFDLWLLRLGDAVPHQLTRSDGDDRHPSWSPDGRAIVFDRTLGDSLAHLVVLELGPPRAWQLTHPGAALDLEPAWSPGGRQVAFSSTRAGSWDLWSLDLDADPLRAGGAPRPLTASRWNDRRPRWLPVAGDQQAQLVFASNRNGKAAIWHAWRLPR